jgi:hypothetical protein
LAADFLFKKIRTIENNSSMFHFKERIILVLIVLTHFVFFSPIAFFRATYRSKVDTQNVVFYDTARHIGNVSISQKIVGDSEFYKAFHPGFSNVRPFLNNISIKQYKSTDFGLYTEIIVSAACQRSNGLQITDMKAHATFTFYGLGSYNTKKEHCYRQIEKLFTERATIKKQRRELRQSLVQII